MDRRALFFLAAGFLCFAIAPIGHADYGHVAVIVGCAYVVFAVLSFLDARGRSRRRR
jgi:hypothetical protein